MFRSRTVQKAQKCFKILHYMLKICRRVTTTTIDISFSVLLTYVRTYVLIVVLWNVESKTLCRNVRAHMNVKLVNGSGVAWRVCSRMWCTTT